jgi:hypothetical protein
MWINKLTSREDLIRRGRGGEGRRGRGGGRGGGRGSGGWVKKIKTNIYRREFENEGTRRLKMTKVWRLFVHLKIFPKMRWLWVERIGMRRSLMTTLREELSDKDMAFTNCLSWIKRRRGVWGEGWRGRGRGRG